MIITLLTDFGTQDTFAGVLHGIIKTLAPQADVIDLTHHVPPQDIRAGAFALKTAYRCFPAGTTHLAVVDPGVGSARRPIAAQIGEYLYVVPDNGLLSYVLAENILHNAVTLDNAEYHSPHVSRTFHGRDIFAPVAAHLANGVSLERLGTPLQTLTTFAVPQPEVLRDSITCHVIYCDVFGNTFTDLTEDIYARWNQGFHPVSIQAGNVTLLGLVSSYSDVPPGKPLALFGSSGHLEIAVCNGNAQNQLRLHIGYVVTLSRNSRSIHSA